MDKTVKMFQLPLTWPSELIRKYKSKNNKRILLSNVDNRDEYIDSTDFEKALDNLDKDEKMFEKDENNKDNNEINLNSKDEKHQTIEDEDFLISKSLAKIRCDITEKEKSCEDLHGWDDE